MSTGHGVELGNIYRQLYCKKWLKGYLVICRFEAISCLIFAANYKIGTPFALSFMLVLVTRVGYAIYIFQKVAKFQKA